MPTSNRSRAVAVPAIELIAEKGYTNTTAQEIGIRAGYSRAMVRERFGSKEALLDAVLRDYERRIDPEALQRFRADEVVQSFSKGGLQVIDSPTTPLDKLEHIAALLPPEWTAPAATGSAQSCVATIREQLALGADGVILHGATPTELEPILAAY